MTSGAGALVGQLNPGLAVDVRSPKPDAPALLKRGLGGGRRE